MRERGTVCLVEWSIALASPEVYGRCFILYKLLLAGSSVLLLASQSLNSILRVVHGDDLGT